MSNQLEWQVRHQSEAEVVMFGSCVACRCELHDEGFQDKQVVGEETPAGCRRLSTP